MDTEPFKFNIDPKTRFAVVFQYTSVEKTAKNIAKHAQIPLSTCKDWLTKVNDGIDIFQIAEGRGRSRSISRRRVVNELTKNPLTSTARVASKLHITDRSVSRILKEEEYEYRSRKKKHLTEEQKDNRIAFCTEYLPDLEVFDTAFFVDEVGFELGDMHKKKQWIKKGEEGLPIKCDEQERKKRINAWAGISSRGKTRLELYTDSFNAIKYLEILGRQTNYMNKMFPEGCSVVQDQLSSHTEKNVKAWLKKEFKQVIDLPTKSSDLNPIENLWSWLKDRVREDEPENLDELEEY